jgi:hypothetical protein
MMPSLFEIFIHDLLIYLYAVYLTTLAVNQGIYVSNDWIRVNDTLERLCKKVVVA